MAESEIFIVSGLPRSGTSLMMQMLERGGVQILADHQRVADLDNPRGYYELESVKNLSEDTSWISTARGKAVKIISLLLYQLPPTERYRVIFMERNLDEIIASQEAMLGRLDKTPLPRSEMRDAYQVHLQNLSEWLSNRPNIQVLRIGYLDLIEQPQIQCERVAKFLDVTLDVESMKSAVDPSLYRNRRQ